jgi:hypothetical protein
MGVVIAQHPAVASQNVLVSAQALWYSPSARWSTAALLVEVRSEAATTATRGVCGSWLEGRRREGCMLGWAWRACR